MINFKGQEELFRLIGSELRNKLECILVGGSAMLFYGAKTATKDIDLVALDTKSFDVLKRVLENLGFAEKNLVSIFKHYDAAKRKPAILLRGDTRVDLFCKEIICFEITSSVLERIKEIHEFGNLIIKVVSPEDIILMKCATERERDIADAAELASRFSIDWKVLIDESMVQTEKGKLAFPVFLYQFLHELKDSFKTDVPADVFRELEKASLFVLKKLKKR